MVSPLVIFLNDPIGIVAVFALIFIKMQFPQVVDLINAKRKKRALVIEFTNERIFHIRQAIYKNNLWKVLSGKNEFTETFQAKEEYAGSLFGCPAIATYVSESAAIPPKEMVLLKHLQDRFGIYSKGELDTFIENFEDRKAEMQSEIDGRLGQFQYKEAIEVEIDKKLEDHSKEINQEMIKKKLKSPEETDLYKQLHNPVKTNAYKEITDYKTTQAYLALSENQMNTFDEFYAIRDTGLFLKHVEVIRFSDLDRFLLVHHDPRATRISELIETSMERAKHIDRSAGIGGMFGGFDIKKIAIIAAIIIIAYAVLPSLMSSADTAQNSAQAFQSAANTISTAKP